MKKLHKIVVIPFRKNIEVGDILSNGSRGFYMWEEGFKNPKGHAYKLLLLSDEEIKKGNKVYIHGKIVDAEEDYGTIRHRTNVAFLYFQKGNKKIIATYPQINSNYPFLPTFSKEFIQEWINNPVEEVEVEYDRTIRSKNYDMNPDDGGMETVFGLAHKQNNDIICNIPETNNQINKSFIDQQFMKFKESITTTNNERVFDINTQNLKVLLKLFCLKFPLHRGIQILDSDIDNFINEYKK